MDNIIDLSWYVFFCSLALVTVAIQERVSKMYFEVFEVQFIDKLIGSLFLFIMSFFLLVSADAKRRRRCRYGEQ